MEEKQLRAIVAKRLSSLTDATTHLKTETESLDEFCKRKNFLVVAETEDLDVSGGKPIRDRPKIGPWLTLDHLDEWDVLVIYKLDRGFRNHLDFVTFYHEFCEVHGKRIISVGEEGLDMSTSMGRMFAGILVQFAEWELTTMKERRAAAAKITRREARYGGGLFPFGYEPYKDGPYWYLRPHPVYAKEVMRMAEAIVSGKSVWSVAEDLNKRRVLTSHDACRKFFGKPLKGTRWTNSSVIQILRSDSIRGFVQYYAKVEVDGNRSSMPPVRVTGPDGEYARREPLIDDELWFRLQDALNLIVKIASGVRSNGSVLLEVAFCGYCGAPLHAASTSQPKRGKRWDYYQCKHMRNDHRLTYHCEKSKGVPKAELEDTVFSALLSTVGRYETTRKQVAGGDDHGETLKQIGMQIVDLSNQHYMHGGVADFHARMAELQAEHERISVMPKEPPKIRRVSTGQTFRQHWDEMDDEQRHSYLKSSGISVLVVRTEDFSDIGLVFTRSADTADDVVLDIPLNIIRTCGNFVVNISLGALAEQLQRASAAS